eukprot:TRINITY_DN1511_c0_g2_i1.p2 TRINITY_DN1511_c0_g2~~TRINITY_DN1511_c0_g2_i1.p2  ORF type:complete len:123 (-),score=47.62 TRINITY_DN1511_c0_g2_i1:703-1071(-)
MPKKAAVKKQKTEKEKEKEEEGSEAEEEEEEEDETNKSKKRSKPEKKTGASEKAGQNSLASIDFSIPAKNEGQLKIISWNVAGLKACLKKGFKDYLQKENPDIMCLQETKADGAVVPDRFRI